MAQPYPVHVIEARWRDRWERSGLNRIDLDTVDSDRVFYNLVEFPYPSAEGLHVGHVFRYVGVDAFGRYQRMCGRAVFQPIGFDSFGIHAENYALNVGEHPRRLTEQTTARYREQLSSIGAAWDWSRAIDTSKPEYYRWTQWTLVQLFKAGLMYQAEAPVIWCPSCLTVLAREQTDRDGTVCERCGSPVTERVMKQWFLRTTHYADRLLSGLDDLEWPDRSKRLQRQWIGRSEGRDIDFGDLTVFTTRPDTLPAVTFIAVPAGHPAAGSTRRHPTSGAPIPVVVTDYVVESYGTGAVMGVPAHDDRDARFAAEHGLPVSDAPLLDPVDAAAVGRPSVRYRMHDWLISRQRYWGPPIPIIHCESCGAVPVPEEDLPVVLPDLDDIRPTGDSPLAECTDWVQTTCPSCGGPASRDSDVSDTFVDSAWYFLRYPSTEFDDVPWDNVRTDKVLPVDFYAGGSEHVQRHHLYARFMTMALQDLGLVSMAEPLPRIALGGMIILAGAKMSKSRGNVVSPDGYVAEHGIDVLRCSLLFSAPWGRGGEFSDRSIAGIERFFARCWRAVAESDGPESAVAQWDHTISAVTRAVERMSFNVALARLMEFVDHVRSAEDKSVLVRLLAPLAPHLAEELWHQLGQPFSVHDQPWPEASSDGAAEVQDLAVQVDGRLRGRISLPRTATGEDAAALARSNIAAVPAKDAVKRVVYVPGRVINFVSR
ncbi:MAG: class I tRNA ligase family protein [Acidimicrobiia bacterium]|nr:class I tRNA ligase family protein [Acidimicrobiia bacterium]